MKNRPLFLLLSALSITALCSCSKTANTDFATDLTIQDFANYSQIGVGIRQSSKKAKRAPSGLLDRYNALPLTEGSMPALVGEDSSGNYKEISLATAAKKNVSIPYYLSGMETHGDLSLLCYTSNPPIAFSLAISGYSENNPMYMLSHKTGNLYYLNEVCENRYPACFSVGCGTVLFGDSRRFSEQNGKLLIENFSNLENTQITAADRYGNGIYFAFSKQGEDYYVLTRDNAINRINYVGLGYDDKVYVQNGNVLSVLNEKGEIVDSAFQPTGFRPNLAETWSEPEDLFLDEIGKTRYYLNNQDGGVEKIAFAEDGSYAYSVLKPGGFTSAKYANSIAAEDGMFYYLGNGTVYQFDLAKEQTRTILAGYSITSLINDNKGHIIFSGKDDHLNDVRGYILKDGTVDLNVQEGDYSLISVAPVN